MAEGQVLFWQKGSLEEQGEHLLALGLPETGAKVLSVGCGEAPLLRWIAGKRPRWRLTGIDLCAASLGQACLLAGEQRSGMDLLQVDLYALPFAEEEYDLVFARGVWEHLADPEAAVRAMRRVVKPQGVVVVWA